MKVLLCFVLLIFGNVTNIRYCNDHGGDLEVSVLTYRSDDPSLKPIDYKVFITRK